MKSYEANCEISAPADVVWKILANRKILAGGGFGITRIEGDISGGGKIKLWSEVSPNRAFKLNVSRFDPPSRMVWESGLPFGIFKGVRTFTLTPNTTGTRFHMQEIFSGLMSGIIVKSIPELGPSFEKFAQALKQTSEERK